MIQCSFCKTENSDDRAVCVSCGVRLADVADAVKPVLKEGPDFEHNGPLSLVSFFITLRQVLFMPRKTLSGLDPEISLFNSLVYVLAGGMIGSFFGGLWQYIANQSELWNTGNTNWMYNSFSGLTAFWMMSPFIIIIFLLMASAVCHLFLRMVGAKGTFTVTLKVLAYTQGSIAPLGIVPVVGTFISAIWGFVCSIKGLGAAHKISTVRALFAVVAPFILLCGFVILLIVAAMSLGLLALFSKSSGMDFLKNFIN